MTFYRINSQEPVAEILAGKILSHLSEGQKVFWIVTGGSGIKLGAAASKLLHSHDLSKLSVTLSDERFGPEGHAESNWHQLEQAGFSLPGALLLPVLSGKSLAATADDYAANLAEQFAAADYSLGLIGIGPDGHVAGILPGSPNIATEKLAVGYSDNEVKQDSPEGVLRGIDRLTMTAAAIARLDEAVVCALGETKHHALDMLERTLPVGTQPCQALKQAASLSIYNDYKGETI